MTSPGVMFRESRTTVLGRSLVLCAIFGLTAFVGGPAAFLMSASVAMLAVYLLNVREVRADLAVAQALLLQVTFMGLACVFLLPILKHVSIAPINALFDGSQRAGFKIADSSTVSDAAREVSRYGALLIIATPGVVALMLTFRQVKKESRSIFCFPMNWSLGWVSALALVGFLKFSSPWSILAAVSSGDGRNNMLLVMAARMSALTPSSFVDVGILPNSVAGLISAGNGANGIRDVADLWSMSFVYLLALGMILLSVSVLLDTRGDSWISRLVAGLVAVLGGLLMSTNPALLSFCLNDGFLSLYFATGVMMLGCAVCVGAGSCWLRTVAMVSTSVALMFSYVLMVPAWLFFCLASAWKWLAARIDRRATKIIIPAVVSLTLITVWLVGEELWRVYLESVTLSGAFIPMGPAVLVLLVLAQSLLALYSSGDRALQWLGVTALGLASLIQYSIIEIANSSFFADIDSYYGTKILVSTTVVSVGMSLTLCVRNLYCSERVMGGLLARSACAALLLVGGSEILASQTRLSSAIPEILNDWGYPDAAELSTAVSHWHGPPFVFVEFSQSLDKASGTWRAETRDANDRLLNFWSPLFWNSDPVSTIDYYNWIYGNWKPTDLSTMCPILQKSGALVITRSLSLEDRLNTACGQRLHFVVLS